MTVEPDRPLCRQCGGTLPPRCPEGLCPACLLESGLLGDAADAGGLPAPGGVTGEYEILEELGAGGMGVVFLARQRSLDRLVALKVIRGAQSSSRPFVARFRREAAAAARLSHPHIVPVYEAGEIDGCHYYTMKFLAGARSLGSLVSDSPLEPRRAAAIVIEIARAVHHAHQHAIIHRDLKPANILVDPQGAPHLIDFGLAKLLEADHNLTDGASPVGTPNYMSPEQVAGKELTTSTDVYALGAILYELLTGRPPFQADSIPEVLRLVAESEPQPLRQRGRHLPADLEVICLKCLEKSPDRRYGSADALAEDLQLWMDSRPIVARRASLANRAAKYARRHPTISSVAAMLTMVGLGVGAFGLYSRHEADLRFIDDVPGMAASRRETPSIDRLGQIFDTLEEAARRFRRWRLVDPASFNAERFRSLQDEAIASLDVIDATPTGRPGIVHVSPSAPAAIDRNFTRIATTEGTDLVVRDVSETPERGRAGEIVRIATDAAFSRLRFGPRGRFLAAVRTPDGPGGEGAPTRRELLIFDVEARSVVHTGTSDGPEAFDFLPEGGGHPGIVVVSGGSLRHHPLDGTVATPASDWIVEGPATCVRCGGEIGGRPAVAIARAPEDATGIAVLSIHDLATGETRASQDVAGRVHDLAWNPVTSQIAAGCAGGEVVVWDWARGAGLDPPFRPHAAKASDWIKRVAWHPRGVLLAATSSNGQLHVWHVAKSNLEITGSVAMADLAFSPDGGHMGLYRRDRQLSYFAITEGLVCFHARGHPTIDFSRGENFFGGAWYPEESSRVFATAADDGVRVWNRRGFQLAHLDSERNARAVLFTENRLFVSSVRGVTARDASITGNTLRLGPPRRIGTLSDCRGLAVDPARRRLAVACPGRIHWCRLDDLALEDPPLPTGPDTHFVAIDAPRGRWLAAGPYAAHAEGDGIVRVWDLGHPAKPPETIAATGNVSVAFSPDAEAPEVIETLGRSSKLLERLAHQWLVTGDGTHGYRFWVHDPSDGSWRIDMDESGPRQIPANLGALPGVMAFSPRGTALAVSQEVNKTAFFTAFGSVRLADPYFDTQFPVCISPDGRFFVSADTGTHLHIWDLLNLRVELDKLGLDWPGLPPFKLRVPDAVDRSDVSDP